MKAWVDKSGCIACELCPTICPEVFRMGMTTWQKHTWTLFPRRRKTQPGKPRTAVLSVSFISRSNKVAFSRHFLNFELIQSA